MTERDVRSVNITVEDNCDIERVAGELGAAGLHVSSVLTTLGIISGDVPAGQLPTLKSIRGVIDVEQDRQMKTLDSED